MVNMWVKRTFTVVCALAVSVMMCSCSMSGLIADKLHKSVQPSPSSAADDIKYYMYVVNCDQSISLRSAPEVSAPEIMQVALGVQVGYIDSAENGFYKIAVGDTVGYALASYLSGQTTGSDNTVKYYMYVVNCKSSITLRSAADVNSSEMAQIPYGTPVGVVNEGQNGFYKVKYNGLIGYASSAYLSTSMPAAAPPPVQNTASVTALDVEMFIDGSLRAFVNGINTGDTSYISRYFTGDEAAQERKSHDSIVQSVQSEEILSLNCHSGKIVTSEKATCVRDSTIRVVYDDGSVKDIAETYLYTVKIYSDGSMKITDLEEL